MKVGDLVKIKASERYCEVTEVYNKPSSDQGHCWVEFCDTGAEATFRFDEVEVVDEKVA